MDDDWDFDTGGARLSRKRVNAAAGAVRPYVQKLGILPL